MSAVDVQNVDALPPLTMVFWKDSKCIETTGIMNTFIAIPAILMKCNGKEPISEAFRNVGKKFRRQDQKINSSNRMWNKQARGLNETG